MNWALRSAFVVAFAVATVTISVLFARNATAEGAVDIKDVRQAETIRLSSQQPPIEISGIELRLKGFIAGRATIAIEDGPPVTLQGQVDTGLYADHFSEQCVVHYVPDEVDSGQLRVHFIFH